MFSWIARPLLARRLRDSPPLPSTVDEAASQFLGKQAKLETALDAALVRQMHEIAQDELATVQEYRAKKLGLGGGPNGSTGRKQPVGDFIVCDD